jgi:hypothetical protein
LEAALGSLEIQAHLGLKKIHCDRHAACELRAILVEDKQIVNIQDTPDAQLLQETHEGAEQFGAYARGFGHTEADGAPLEAAAVRRVVEPAILPL